MKNTEELVVITKTYDLILCCRGRIRHFDNCMWIGIGF